MKKILIFSLNYYPKFIGGAEVSVKEVTDRLDSNKYEFHMITLRFDSSLPKVEKIGNVKVYRIGFTSKNANISDLKKFPLKLNKYLYQFTAFLYAIKLHLKYDFDACFAVMAHSCGVPAGLFKTIFPNVKYFLNLQEGDPTEDIEKLARPIYPLFKRAFTKADIITSLSTFLSNWSEKMGNNSVRVVIPNGVDLLRFEKENDVQKVEEVKKKLKKKEGETWLITTSRLVKKNGIDTTIDAIKLLKDIGQNVHFAVLGIGPDKEKLLEQAKKLGVQHLVHFIGEVKHPEIVYYLRACDIFIRASRSEGMGNSFVEAMSLKMPVLATCEGGLSDFIFDRETAFVVHKENAATIRNKVVEILEYNKIELQKILDHSYDMVKKRFDWEVIAERMKKEVFEKV